MTTNLRDALTQRINEVGPANPDIEELVGLGEQRLRRRRRFTAAAAAGAAVAVAIAFAIGGSALLRSADQSPGPIDRPPTDPNKTQTTSPTPTRPIVYSDDVVTPHGDVNWIARIGTLHLGDREVRIDQTLRTVRGWPLGLTDAGVVYAQDDGSVWFTDGGQPRRIAEQTCAGTSPTNVEGLVTGDGPWAAWFDCTPAHQGDLVVFDTSSGQEVASQRIPSCPDIASPACGLDTIIGEHLYIGDLDSGHLRQLDVTTGNVVAATPQMYSEELRSHPGAFVLGDSWRTGTPTTGLEFDVVGSRLVPVDVQPGPEPRHTQAFDTATGQSVQLRLPSGYSPDPNASGHLGFEVFEWLNDDTVALAQESEEWRSRDILTCRLSDGHCDLAVEASTPDEMRLVIGEALP